MCSPKNSKGILESGALSCAETEMAVVVDTTTIRTMINIATLPNDLCRRAILPSALDAHEANRIHECHRPDPCGADHLRSDWSPVDIHQHRAVPLRSKLCLYSARAA